MVAFPANSEKTRAVMDHPSLPSLNQAPINTAQVCARWRRIALHWSFWSNIVLMKPHMRHFEAILLFLDRAKGKKLSIKCVEWTFRYSSRALDIQLLCDIINARCSEWRELDLDMRLGRPSIIAWKELMVHPLIIGPLPQVERLSLMASFFIPKTSTSLLDLSESSRLRELHLHGPWSIKLDPNQTNFDRRPALPSLISLGVNTDMFVTDYPSAGLCLQLLSHAPNLQSLDVVLATAVLLESTALRLEHLRTLRIFAPRLTDNVVSRFLSCLTLPALKELDVYLSTSKNEEVDGPVVFDRSSISNLLQRSACSLDMLRINCKAIFDEEIIACLQLSPDLRSLAVVYLEHAGEKLLSTLTRSPNIGGPRLQNLRHLRLGWSCEHFYPDTNLKARVVEMVKSRWYNRATPSERLCIKICGLEFRGKMRMELHKMVSEGLEFDLST